ncbi:thioesterase II family protein [Pseudonocardia sp. HH130630-07]|uniref:thioesterase II family protein n=1 Tax=Pseudonocardia sp. HH130630-07 TaxID=1690815 RepID=UPI000814C8E0|nr:alpha/beta fold hydrolase [Pseudonocardia sp. HH130630-07]ANY07728.1 hypothetical protein AFB00_17125 [Pseudonocardia sp. HH130630-07]
MSDWLHRVRPVSGAQRTTTGDRLVVWPHAGGSPAAFGSLAAALPEIEVWGIVPPGRGLRLDEEAVVEPDAAVAGAVRALDALPGAPGRTVVFGHSLGGAMAARLAAHRGCDLLVVSGWPGPGRVPPSPVGRAAEELDTAALLEFVDRLDAPGRVELRDPELQPFLLPPLLADLRMGDRVAASTPARPGMPVVTVAGRADPAFGVSEIAGWAEHVDVVEAVVLDGGHFAVLTDVTPVAAAIRRALATNPVGLP